MSRCVSDPSAVLPFLAPTVMAFAGTATVFEKEFHGCWSAENVGHDVVDDECIFVAALS